MIGVQWRNLCQDGLEFDVARVGAKQDVSFFGERGSDERIELCFNFLEGGEGVGVSVHIAGPAFHACGFEG